jgi:hypothetical protein
MRRSRQVLLERTVHVTAGLVVVVLVLLAGLTLGKQADRLPGPASTTTAPTAPSGTPTTTPVGPTTTTPPGQGPTGLTQPVVAHPVTAVVPPVPPGRERHGGRHGGGRHHVG